MDTARTIRNEARPRPSIGRIATIGALTLAAAVVVEAPTIALTVGRIDPELGRRFWPIGAKVQADQATAVLAADPSLTPATLAKADALSRGALRREPVNVAAARTQAIIAGARNQPTAAVAWLRYAEGLSRRDFATQTMLIELAVTRGDVVDALVHYDRALLTKRSAGEILFPILFSAASDPNVLPPLTRLLARRPEWWWDFTIQWLTHTPPVEPMFAIVMAEKPDLSQPRERALALTAMRQLVAGGRSDLAMRLHDRIAPRGSAPAGGFVDGTFSGDPDLLPPFAWDYTTEPSRTGIAERRDPYGRVLTIDVSDAQGGVVAQQLVRLSPGRYRLSFRAGEISPNGVVPSVSVTCDRVAAPFAELRLTPGNGPRALDFQIPAGCPAQWIRVNGTAGEDDGLPRPWIGNMVLSRGA